MEEFLGKFVLFGMPGVPLVMLLVEILKRALGLPSKWAPLASLLVGLAVAGVIALIEFVPGAEAWVMYILAGILMGAASAGFYGGVKTLAGFKTAAPGSVVVPPSPSAEMRVAPPGSTIILPTGEARDVPVSAPNVVGQVGP
jgi:hypothetical protein